MLLKPLIEYKLFDLNNFNNDHLYDIFDNLSNELLLNRYYNFVINRYYDKYKKYIHRQIHTMFKFVLNNVLNK